MVRRRLIHWGRMWDTATPGGGTTVAAVNQRNRPRKVRAFMPKLSTEMSPLILASASQTRLDLLRNVGLEVEAVAARIDEDAVRRAMADQPGRDIADRLAEMKAAKIAGKRPEALVLGFDQVLVHKGEVLGKAETPDALVGLLDRLSGTSHILISAAVAYEKTSPVWRTASEATLHVRVLSPEFIEDYVSRNWDTVRHSLGGYNIEGEGARLFTRIEGDHFAVLGLPLLPLLSWFHETGRLAA